VKTIDFGDGYRRTYREMLRRIRDCFPTTACRAFWPIAGRDYETQTERLFFTGQAVGRWSQDEIDPNDDTYRAWFAPDRPHTLSGIENYSLPDDDPRCPLAWFESIRGQFHDAVGTLCGGDRGWASRIAWSNLYKVVQDPKGHGNPIDPLCDEQFDHCRELFRVELERLRPTCTFVLAGAIWYEPFFKPPPEAMTRARARQVGAFRTHGEHLVVVAPHPRSWCLRGLTLASLRTEIGDAISAVAETTLERALASKLTDSTDDGTEGRATNGAAAQESID